MKTTVYDSLFTELLNKGTIKTPDQGVYTPTLMVGLGGTGMRVLGNLKEILQRHEASHIRMLGIDSDVKERTLYKELPEWKSSEFVLLDQTIAMRALRGATKGDKQFNHILKYLPRRHGKLRPHSIVEDKIRQQLGAGQFRRAGRLLFCSNVNDGAKLQTTFKNVKSELTSLNRILREKHRGMQISQGTWTFVICSVAGGTGAGCLLDCLALLRSVFDGEHDVITVIGVLPGDLLDKENKRKKDREATTRGNAVGTLNELQALAQGKLSKFKFRFDHYDHFQVQSKVASNIFLVDNANHNGRSPEGYMELCRAAAYFLYALAGSGVGIHSVAHQINESRKTTAKAQKANHIFNALGIGAIEYPATQLRRCALRLLFDEWTTEWLKSVRSAVAAEWIPPKPEEFIGRFLQSVDMRRMEWLSNPDELVDALKNWSDAEFLKHGEQARKTAKDRISQFKGNLDNAATMEKNRLKQELYGLTLKWLPHGIHVAQNGLRNAMNDLKTLQQQLERKAPKAGKFRQIVTSVTALSVHAVDWGFDSSLRQAYVNLMNKYIHMEAEKEMIVRIRQCLKELMEELETSHGLVAQLKSIEDSALHDHADNKARLQEIADTMPHFGFVQSLLTNSECLEWVRANRPKMGAPPVLYSNLDWATVVKETLAPALGQFDDVMTTKLDVLTQAIQDEEVLRRATSINEASVPLIKCSGLNPDDLNPLYFIAYKPNEGAKKFFESLDPEKKREIGPIEIGNGQVVIAARTYHGFGIEHWDGYKKAKTHYDEDPWYHDALS